MCSKSIQKLFGALVIVSLVLTSIGSTRGAASRQMDAPSVTGAAMNRDAMDRAAPQAATPIDPSPYAQYSPKLAGDSAGNLFALWLDMREGDANPHIRFAYRPAGGAWQPSSKLDGAGVRQYDAALAVDGSGNTYAAWTDRRGGYDQIYFATRPAGGAWSAGQVISPTLSSQQPQTTPSLAVNQRGDAVVAWAQGQCCVNPQTVYIATRPAGGSWGVAEVIGQGHPWLCRPAVALDGWGRISVVWVDFTGKQVSFAGRPAGGPWSAVRNIRDSAVGRVTDPLLAVDSAGNVHSVWRDERNGGWDLYAAYRPADGPWSANVSVMDNPGGDENQPALAVDGAGNASAFWNHAGSAIYTATRYRGGGWGPNQPLVMWPTMAGSVASPAASLPQQESVSFSPDAIALATATALFFTAPVGDTDVYNLYFQETSAVGSSGQCGQMTGVLTACHAGNAVEAPAQDSDQGAYPPNAPLSSGSGYAIGQQQIDGQTIYVVQAGDGQNGAFDNQGDAEAFAAAHAMPNDPLASFPDIDFFPDLDFDDFDLGLPDFASFPDIDFFPDLDFDNSDFDLSDFASFPNIDFFPDLDFDNSDFDLSDLIDVPDFDLGLLDWETLAQEQAELEQEAEALAEAQAQEEAEPEVTTAQVGPTTVPEAGTASAATPAVGTLQLIDELSTKYPRYFVMLWKMAGKDPEKFLAMMTIAGPELLELASKSPLDPVLPHSGEFIRAETLLRIAGRGLDYALQLTYRSQLVYNGPAGWGWTHTYDRRVADAGAGSLGLWDGAGLAGIFSFDGASFTPSAGRFTAVVSDATGITLADHSGLTESYFPLDGSPAAGRLRAISDRNGNTLAFAYDAAGRLQTVTDTLGRVVTYAYDAHDRITTVTDYAGRAVRLTYDANGDLVSITSPAVTGTPQGNDFPQGKTTRFAYTSGFSDQRLNHNLTTIISPNEVADGSLTPRTVNTYGTEGLAFDRVTRQSWGGGRANASGIPAGGTVTLAYSTAIEPTAPPGAHSKTTITDRGGNVLEFWHDGAGHRLADRQVVDGQPLLTSYTYDADGLLTAVTYPAGNRVEYRYDDAATNRLAQGNLLEVRRVPDAARGCDGLGSTPCPALVTAYTYDPSLSFSRLKTLTDPRGATTTYGYDARGNLTRVTFPNVTVGPSAPQSASESWTYNAFGQPLTYTDPEGKVTRYEYYATGPSTGYRQRVIRDSGGLNVTTEYTYDAVGNLTSRTDGRGVRADYVVNALNQVVKVTRAATGTRGQGSGDSTEYAVRNTQDIALDYETLYTYDANDNLVRRDVENVQPDLDADFHPTGSHSRDAANPWWTTSYTYDLLDNRVRQVAEVSATASVTTEYRYDPLERLAAVTFPVGNRVEYAYDERGLLRRVTQGAGATEVATTTYAYDANGNPTQVTDGEGHPTDTVYDGFDRPVGRVDALGNVRLWRYDGNGNLVETLARDGQDGRNPGRTLNATGLVTLSQSQYSYDERNRPYAAQQAYFSADVGTGVLTPITADGDGDGWVETAYAYDRNGNLTALTDDRGQTTRYAYDGLDRLTQRADALNNTIAYTYDGAGNLTQSVATERQPDALAPTETFTTTSSYDAANRLVTVTDNLGRISRYAYDSRGNLVFRSDANGPVTQAAQVPGTSEVPGTFAANAHGNTALLAYDGLGRRLSETYHLRVGGLGSGAVTGQVVMAYAYDGNGNLTQRADPNGNATAYVYDPLDRLTRVTYADGTATTYAYDRASNLTRQTDPTGTVIAHTYDAADRRTRTDVTRGAGVGGTTLQTFAWDGLGRLAAATDNNDPATAADDSALAFAYDSLGNTRRETQDGRTAVSAYDGLGNRLSLTYPGGKALAYTYDALSRIKTVADGGSTLATFDYIGPWRLLRRTDGNGTYASYTYDAGRQVTRVAYRLTSNQLPVSSFQYTYDRAGNRLSETAQPGNRPTSYAYDSLSRLTNAQLPASSFQYTYDAASNRTQTSAAGRITRYTTNAVNEYLVVGREARSYDANGNLRQAHRSATSGFRLYLPLLLKSRSAPAAPAAAADANHRGPAATAPTTETEIRYRYDFRNRLIGLTRTVTDTAAAGAQAVTTAFSFTYDALDRQVRTVMPAAEQRLVYAGNQIIEERNPAGAVVASYVGRLTMNRGGARIFYQTDALGSVRGLADAAGAVIEQVEYDPFGAPTFSRGGHASAFGNPYLFRGLRYDADNTFYVTGGRCYEPATGRTIQRGPVTLGNPYPFASNNPMRAPAR